MPPAKPAKTKVADYRSMTRCLGGLLEELKVDVKLYRSDVIAARAEGVRSAA